MCARACQQCPCMPAMPMHARDAHACQGCQCMPACHVASPALLAGRSCLSFVCACFGHQLDLTTSSQMTQPAPRVYCSASLLCGLKWTQWISGGHHSSQVNRGGETGNVIVAGSCVSQVFARGMASYLRPKQP